jgi:hypothetical protein
LLIRYFMYSNQNLALQQRQEQHTREFASSWDETEQYENQASFKVTTLNDQNLCMQPLDSKPVCVRSDMKAVGLRVMSTCQTPH